MGYTICPEKVQLCPCGVVLTVRMYLRYICGAEHTHTRWCIVATDDGSSTALHLDHLDMQETDA